MAMNNPLHPGAIVREDCLKPLGLSVTEGAKRLGIGRQTLSNLVNEKASVSIEMAYRLSKAFGSTPETWLAMQLAYDLARSRHREQKIKGIIYQITRSHASNRAHPNNHNKNPPPLVISQRMATSSAADDMIESRYPP